MGGRVGRLLLRVAAVSGAGAFMWNVVLDEQARSSVKRAAAEVSNLASFAAERYMETGNLDAEDAATKRNQAWVRQQWERAGY